MSISFNSYGTNRPIWFKIAYDVLVMSPLLLFLCARLLKLLLFLSYLTGHKKPNEMWVA